MKISMIELISDPSAVFTLVSVAIALVAVAIIAAFGGVWMGLAFGVIMFVLIVLQFNNMIQPESPPR